MQSDIRFLSTDILLFLYCFLKYSQESEIFFGMACLELFQYLNYVILTCTHHRTFSSTFSRTSILFQSPEGFMCCNK